MKSSSFIVVAYYTADTLYEEEARLLVQSLDEHQVPYYVQRISSKGNWFDNTHYKPSFLLSMMDRFPDLNLVYVDVDARFEQYPTLFDTLSCVIGVHCFDRSLWISRSSRGKEILSGTIFLKNCPLARQILERWRDRCFKKPNEWDQKCLEYVLGDDYFRLPPEYCKIFDTMARVRNPVIVHYQASRKLRKVKGLYRTVPLVSRGVHPGSFPKGSSPHPPGASS